MTRKAFMAFMAEAPIVGLDPHPAYAPQEEISTFDAAGYAEAIGAYSDRQSAEDESADDYAARLEAVEDGDLEDADEKDSVFEVAIHDDGKIEVIHDEPRYVFATYQIEQVYEAYGMTMPTKPQS